MPRPSALEKGMGDHNIGQHIVRALIAGERIPREGKAQSRTGNTSLEAQAAGGKAGKEPGTGIPTPSAYGNPHGSESPGKKLTQCGQPHVP